jgi:uncharacterized protein involved in propanediol utilization
LSGCSGRARAIGHAGELLQGVLEQDGVQHPFLVTLPAPCLTSEACVAPADAWSVEPAWKVKALAAARLATAGLNLHRLFRLTLNSSVPIGRGLGSSTADCVAAIRAVAYFAGVELPRECIANLAQRAEVACDSTMFDSEVVVFLPRQGALVESFGQRWPALWVEVVDLGGAPVDTVTAAIPQYSREELRQFARLRDDLRIAFAQQDPAAIARVATASGEIHQRYRPAAEWPTLVRESLSRGAYGVARAHSGTAAAILSRQPLGFSDLSYRLG